MNFSTVMNYPKIQSAVSRTPEFVPSRRQVMSPNQPVLAVSVSRLNSTVRNDRRRFLRYLPQIDRTNRTMDEKMGRTIDRTSFDSPFSRHRFQILRFVLILQIQMVSPMNGSSDR